MTDTIRVVIADDHPIVREGLRMLLEMADGFACAGEAADGESVLRVVAETQPDVVLMDLRMPGMDGLAAIRRISTDWPRIALLILTTYNEDEFMIQGLQAGAKGYLLKDADIAVLLEAIRTVARGELLVQPEVMTRILAYAAQGAAATRAGDDAALTDREHEVLAAIVRGERTKEIALHLNIAERTVRAHLTSIYIKLNVDSRISAVAAALARGLVPRQP